jgi:hypothetical protein
MSETLSSVSPIDAAARAQTAWFVGYIVVLFAAAALTVLLRQATNRYQSLVKRDADARIVEATRGAAQANERTAALEKDNLILRKDVNEAAGKVAIAQRDAAAAQKDAADARVAQQRVEVELARQQERAARAERSLLELQEKLKPRVLSSAQRDQLVKLLAQAPKDPVEVFQVAGDREAFEFALQIVDALRAAGWDTVGRSDMLGISLRGSVIAMPDLKNPPPHTVPIQRAFTTAGIGLPGIAQDMPEGTVRIIVGTKP